MPAKKTAKKAAKKAAPKTADKTTKKGTKTPPKAAKKITKTEAQTKKGRKIKAGQFYECGICGFRFVVDECGCVEEHYLICCEEIMKQKRQKPATK